jgi:Beta-propeller domains of methanol dehydrogenase type
MADRVLLLVAISDRKLRIEAGYGLEAVITDLEAREIIDNVITPRFKLNDYNTGIYDGISAIANIIYK